jgi:GntR family transcriptional regulator, transcriptional repressor for pyruvate dehydrogenase complex
LAGDIRKETTMSELPHLSRTSLVDEVIYAIQKMVGKAGWTEGSKLPTEQDLGRQLGVGRSTIREALRVLGHLGVVESRAGLGTYVVNRGMPKGTVKRPLSPQALNELYEFRLAIEMPAARLAAERRTTKQMSNIAGAWQACTAAVKRNDTSEYAKLDYNFHYSIVQASGNSFFADAYSTIKTSFVDYVGLMLGLGPLKSMLHFHDKLLDAIKRRDAAAAAEAVAENFRETDVRMVMLAGDLTSSRTSEAKPSAIRNP